MTSEIRTSLKILETDAIVVVVRYSISKSCYKGIHHDFRSKKIRYSLFYMDSQRGLSLELKKIGWEPHGPRHYCGSCLFRTTIAQYTVYG
jgi:hypothetical protein